MRNIILALELILWPLVGHERDVTIERIDEKEELGLLVRVTRAAGQEVSRHAIFLLLDVDDKRRCSNVFHARAVLFDRDQVLQKKN